MEELFNKKSLEQLIKKWVSEVIDEKLIPKVFPFLREKEKEENPKKLVKLKEASWPIVKKQWTCFAPNCTMKK